MISGSDSTIGVDRTVCSGSVCSVACGLELATDELLVDEVDDEVDDLPVWLVSGSI